MDDTEIFALMSRVHVILRHRENRIADVARMQVESDYAREIVNVCMHSTHAELVKLGVKLEEALFGTQGKFLRQPAHKPVDTLRDKPAAAGHAASQPESQPQDPDNPSGKKKYIRSLR